MRTELSEIIQSYNDLKANGLNDDPIKAAEEIQAISNIFHSHLISLALGEPDFNQFYSDYSKLIKKAEKLKNQDLRFSINVNKIVITRNGVIIKNEPILSPIRLKNIYYNGKKELDPIIELFFCHKKVYQLINFLTYIE